MKQFNFLKKTFKGVLVSAALLAGMQQANGQGMAVNTTGAAANSSAMLDVSSTTQGMLIPRMTNGQLTAIASPATGLLVYQTDGTAGFYFYNGSSWVSLSSAAGTAGGDLTGSYPNPTIKNSASTGNNIITAINASGGGLSGTELATNSVSVNAMSATGTRNSTTYLRGDNTWATVSGGSGTVTSVSSGVLTSGTTAFTDTIFHTVVINPTTTPSIFYTFNNAAANSVLTNSTNFASIPVYGKVVPNALYASSGVPSSSTYYRGDGSWQTPASAPAITFLSYFDNGNTNNTGNWYAPLNAAISSGGNFTLTTSVSFSARTITIAPIGCIFNELDAVSVVSPPVGSGTGNEVFTLYKNGSPTSLTCTVTTVNYGTSNSTGTCSDVTHTVSVSAGDQLSIQLSESNISALEEFSVRLKCQ